MAMAAGGAEAGVAAAQGVKSTIDSMPGIAGAGMIILGLIGLRWAAENLHMIGPLATGKTGSGVVSGAIASGATSGNTGVTTSGSTDDGSKVGVGNIAGGIINGSK